MEAMGSDQVSFAYEWYGPTEGSDPVVEIESIFCTYGTSRPVLMVVVLLWLLIACPVGAQNASVESLTRFKQTARDELAALGQLVCDVFPVLTPEKLEEFLHLQGALAVGLYPMAHLSEVQKQAMERAGFEHIGIDFDAQLRHGTEHLLRGFVE
jgi:hypothetical protein